MNQGLTAKGLNNGGGVAAASIFAPSTTRCHPRYLDLNAVWVAIIQKIESLGI